MLLPTAPSTSPNTSHSHRVLIPEDFLLPTRPSSSPPALPVEFPSSRAAQRNKQATFIQTKARGINPSPTGMGTELGQPYSPQPSGLCLMGLWCHIPDEGAENTPIPSLGWDNTDAPQSRNISKADLRDTRSSRKTHPQLQSLECWPYRSSLMLIPGFQQFYSPCSCTPRSSMPSQPPPSCTGSRDAATARAAGF